jgi:hypothetical protein
MRRDAGDCESQRPAVTLYSNAKRPLQCWDGAPESPKSCGSGCTVSLPASDNFVLDLRATPWLLSTI